MKLLKILMSCVAIALLLPAANAAEGTDYSIAELLRPCMEGDNDARWGVFAETECEQYILGFADAYVLLGQAQRDKVCLPTGGNRADEIRWVFMKWANQNFDQRHKAAAEGLLAAIKGAFACK